MAKVHLKGDYHRFNVIVNHEWNEKIYSTFVRILGFIEIS